MNARQKAKKYKRMYEQLLNKPVKYKVEQQKVDTLRFERFYPKELVVQPNDSYFQEVITRDIAKEMVNSLDKYMDYYTEFCPHINKYRFYGEIKFVRR